ncbi:uncharacterized protein BXZ73DRAFT_80944 [Epithele typhae]|uniref:uncharacterized protein n=1 Tax=Epithele typhae TaxID=378194 RepID=UPI0020082C77|nr:uncharacterized protein BXZ73DRAFT_80944 [Epithele typhae]KAH9916978.1 hypothetical protein BXZ73DRAFT_80944 [Epithele typhae]
MNSSLTLAPHGFQGVGSNVGSNAVYRPKGPCTNCRISKRKCDHGTPCLHCVKGNRAESCFYPPPGVKAMKCESCNGHGSIWPQWAQEVSSGLIPVQQMAHPSYAGQTDGATIHLGESTHEPTTSFVNSPGWSQTYTAPSQIYGNQQWVSQGSSVDSDGYAGYGVYGTQATGAGYIAEYLGGNAIASTGYYTGQDGIEESNRDITSWVLAPGQSSQWDVYQLDPCKNGQGM